MHSRFDFYRAEQMASLYKSGKTLAEVGNEYGLTRERVRQILKKVGVAPESGGIAQRARENGRARAEAMNMKCINRWGCTKEQWSYLRSFDRCRAKTPIGRFEDQRNSAKQRGIEWNLTLWQWWKIWEASCKWENRGRCDGEYVMCRYGDQGPYEIGNVVIKTCNDNSDDYWHGSSGVLDKIHNTQMCRSPEKQLIDAEESF